MAGNGNYLQERFNGESQKLTYEPIDPDYLLMRPISNAIMRIQAGNGTMEDQRLLMTNKVFLPMQELKDVCKSKPIICYIVDPKSGLIFAANNGTRSRIPYCVRHALQTDPENLYKECITICHQPAHAEVMAIINYLMWTGKLNEEQFNRIFPILGKADDEERFEVVDHNFLLQCIKESNISFGDGVEVYLYGHEICCDSCAKLLLALGVSSIKLSPETHEDEKIRRTKLHNKMTNSDLQHLKILAQNTTIQES